MRRQSVTRLHRAMKQGEGLLRRSPFLAIDGGADVQQRGVMQGPEDGSKGRFMRWEARGASEKTSGLRAADVGRVPHALAASNASGVGYRVSHFHGTTSQALGVPQESNDSDAGGDSDVEQRSPPTDRVLRLVDEIAELTLLEVADLTKLIKRKLGLPDMPMGGMMPMGMPMGMPGIPGPGAGAAAPEAAAPVVEEKTSFDVKLAKFDAAAKLKVIKEVRAITGLGLKESKELVEGAPAVVKKGVPKEEAESIVEKLKAVGAEVELV